MLILSSSSVSSFPSAAESKDKALDSYGIIIYLSPGNLCEYLALSMCGIRPLSQSLSKDHKSAITTCFVTYSSRDMKPLFI